MSGVSSRLRVTAAALAVLCVGNAVPGGQQGRRVAAGTGVLIEDLVKPDDKVLTVEWNVYPPLLIEPERGVPYIEWLVDQSELVLTLHVTSKRSSVTAEGDWITTIVDAKIEHVLKAPSDWPLRSGDTTSFMEQGGTITIGRTIVHGVVPWARPVEHGQRYLVFTDTVRKGEWSFVPSGAYELGAALRRMMVLPRTEIESSFENEVIARIQRHVARRE